MAETPDPNEIVTVRIAWQERTEYCQEVQLTRTRYNAINDRILAAEQGRSGEDVGEILEREIYLDRSNWQDSHFECLDEFELVDDEGEVLTESEEPEEDL